MFISKRELALAFSGVCAIYILQVFSWIVNLGQSFLIFLVFQLSSDEEEYYDHKRQRN